MNPPPAYRPSQHLTGDTELLTSHGFTRWLSMDLRQVAVDFNRHLGLFPAYSETSGDQPPAPGHLTRYLFWRLPDGALTEIRSSRTKIQFDEFDRVNRERNMPLLSLHVTASERYSAVWITRDHLITAKTWLLAHGITPAERIES